jgi:hypothetical protein
MAITPRLGTFSFYAYDSDNAVTYEVRMNTAKGTAATNTSEAYGTSPAYPVGWKPRHIYGSGLTSSGATSRTSLVICDPTNALWLGSSNTFTVTGAGTYAVEGRIGEKRTAK